MTTPNHAPAAESNEQQAMTLLRAVEDALEAEHSILQQRDARALPESTRRKSELLRRLAAMSAHCFNGAEARAGLARCQQLNIRNGAMLAARAQARMRALAGIAEAPSAYDRRGGAQVIAMRRNSLGLA